MEYSVVYHIENYFHVCEGWCNSVLVHINVHRSPKKGKQEKKKKKRVVKQIISSLTRILLHTRYTASPIENSKDRTKDQVD